MIIIVLETLLKITKCTFKSGEKKTTQLNLQICWSAYCSVLSAVHTVWVLNHGHWL